MPLGATMTPTHQPTLLRASLAIWLFTYTLFGEMMKTLVWFSRIWTYPLANFVARTSPIGLDWNINGFQYIFLPIVPAVTVPIAAAWSYLALYLTGEPIAAAATFAFTYTYLQGGIHLDGYVDTVDAALSVEALNAATFSDKDRSDRCWKIMKEPTIGGLGAYHLNLYQHAFLFSTGYAAHLAARHHSIVLPALIALGFMLARVNCSFLFIRGRDTATLREDEVVSINPSYYAGFTRAILRPAWPFIAGAAIILAFTPITPLAIPFGIAAAAVIAMGNYFSTRLITSRLGFISGDVFGHSIALSELTTSVLAIALYSFATRSIS